jgi:tetratricopeptide (TPR) repeat protein
VRIFISHSHVDSGLADALRSLYGNIFGENRVQVRYSSDQSPGGGIPPGTSWLSWIQDEVKKADRTLVLLTPRSLDRPWLLWESGAVTGAALVSETSKAVVPMLFRTNAEQLPGPLGSLQLIQGDSAKGLKRELTEVNAALGPMYPGPALNAMADQFVAGYLVAVEAALADQPLALTEGAVQEWVSRLVSLRDEKRWADAEALENAMAIAFCPADLKAPALLDVRLHRLLGEIYLKGNRGAKAALQFAQAIKLMPRDVYLLHKLGLAHLEGGQVDDAVKVLERIETLSPKLAERDPEIGGLAGRVWRARWEQTGDRAALRRARDHYLAASNGVPTSYYAADNAGQLSLILGEIDQAKDCFADARRRIDVSGERSVWSLATLATASFILGEPQQTVSLLAELRKRGPTPRELTSIKGGLKRLVDSQQASCDVFATWMKILDSDA